MATVDKIASVFLTLLHDIMCNIQIDMAKLHEDFDLFTNISHPQQGLIKAGCCCFQL